MSLDAKDCSFDALASDAPSAYGLRPDLVLVDEITQHGNRQMFDALYSATGKSPDCQLLVIGNAGVTGSWQRELREQVRLDPDWYFRQVAADEVPWTDPAWLEGQRRILPDALFRRLHLNEWGSDSGSFFEPGAVERCLAAPEDIDPHPYRQAVRRVALGVDLGTRHDLTALAAVGMDGEVDLRAVEEAVRGLFHRWRADATCFDPWQGTLLRQRIEAEVAAEDFAFTAKRVEQLSRVLYEIVSQGRLRFSRDAGRAVVNGEPWNLRRELEELTLRTTSAGWRFDHRDGGYSDRTVALAPALRRLSQDSLAPPLAAAPASLNASHRSGSRSPRILSSNDSGTASISLRSASRSSRVPGLSNMRSRNARMASRRSSIWEGAEPEFLRQLREPVLHSLGDDRR